MKLSEYLIKYNMTKTKLCKDADILPQTLYHIFRGRGVQLKTAVGIEKATRGMVTCKDLYDEFVKKKRKKYTRKDGNVSKAPLQEKRKSFEDAMAEYHRNNPNSAPHGMIYQPTDSSLA